jgi:death-on-curing protein
MQPSSVIYLTAGEVARMNRELLHRAGQPPAPVRDAGLLESAVQRPQNAAFYEGADLLGQAALYMVGIAVNHPFVDGNKRTGFTAGMVFLLINGYLSESADLNRVEFGVWLEQAVNRTLTFEQFVANLREAVHAPQSHSP